MSLLERKTLLARAEVMRRAWACWMGLRCLICWRMEAKEGDWSDDEAGVCEKWGGRNLKGGFVGGGRGKQRLNIF